MATLNYTSTADYWNDRDIFKYLYEHLDFNNFMPDDVIRRWTRTEDARGWRAREAYWHIVMLTDHTYIFESTEGPRERSDLGCYNRDIEGLTRFHGTLIHHEHPVTVDEGL